MSDANILLFLCFALLLNGLIGYFIGNSYKLGALGGLLGIFLGPIGWLIVFAVGVGKNQRERMEMEAYALARRNAPTPAAPAPRQEPDSKLRIRRGAEILGNWPLYEVRDFLEAGNLVWTDEYFDRSSNSWIQLAGHQELE